MCSALSAQRCINIMKIVSYGGHLHANVSTLNGAIVEEMRCFRNRFLLVQPNYEILMSNNILLSGAIWWTNIILQYETEDFKDYKIRNTASNDK